MAYIFIFAHDFKVEEFPGEVRIYGLVIHLGPSSWRGFPRKTGSSYLLYRETFMLNWLVPAWVGSRNKKQQLSTMLFGGSSLTRSVTNGCSAVLLVINLAFWWVYLICRLITYVYEYFDKPRSKGINASRGQAALICKDRNTTADEIHKTANWSLLQGEEEVNKRIKQKIYI